MTAASSTECSNSVYTKKIDLCCNQHKLKQQRICMQRALFRNFSKEDRSRDTMNSRVNNRFFPHCRFKRSPPPPCNGENLSAFTSLFNLHSIQRIGFIGHTARANPRWLHCIVMHMSLTQLFSPASKRGVSWLYLMKRSVLTLLSQCNGPVFLLCEQPVDDL